MSPVPVFAWLMLSVIFAVSGPFGTYERLEPWPRLIFWLVLIGGSLVYGRLVRLGTLRLIPSAGYLRSAIGAAFVSGGVLAIALPPLGQSFVHLPEAMIPGPLEVLLVVIVIGVGVGLMRYALTRAPIVAPDEVGPARLLSRIPDRIGDDILHLSVSDHYVKVVTAGGDGRVLMRFSDAIEEVAEVDGLRVHRSHWVARAAVTGVERAGGRTFVALSNGTKVPVSRAHEGAIDRLGLG